MKIFKLPDLGEGLQEAEIVSWHVKAGDRVVADQPMVSVETAKAIVDMPRPSPGRSRAVRRQGRHRAIGAPLVGIAEGRRRDSGTVVGRSKSARRCPRRSRPASAAAGRRPCKATPAVRALAGASWRRSRDGRRPGTDGMITAADVQRAARRSPSRVRSSSCAACAGRWRRT